MHKEKNERLQLTSTAQVNFHIIQDCFFMFDVTVYNNLHLKSFSDSCSLLTLVVVAMGVRYISILAATAVLNLKKW